MIYISSRQYKYYIVRPVASRVLIASPTRSAESSASRLAEELHHLLANPRHFGPTGVRFRILFQPTNLVPVENEIHLPQTTLWEFVEQGKVLCQARRPL